MELFNAGPPHPGADGSSYANIDYIVTKHFHLNLTIDFDKQIVKGTNTLTLFALKDTS